MGTLLYTADGVGNHLAHGLFPASGAGTGLTRLPRVGVAVGQILGAGDGKEASQLWRGFADRLHGVSQIIRHLLRGYAQAGVAVHNVALEVGVILKERKGHTAGLVQVQVQLDPVLIQSLGHGAKPLQPLFISCGNSGIKGELG